MMRLLPMATLAAMALTATERDRLYLQPLVVEPGKTAQLTISMQNDTAYCGFQTDLKLPQGIDVAYEDGEYIIDLTTRATGSHTVVYSSNNKRMFVSSQDNSTFMGNSGPVAVVTLSVADNFAGGQVSLTGSRCAEPNGAKHTMADCTVELTVDGQTVPGDATGDGQVDIADVNAVINIMLGKAQASATADATGDGLVDIADVNAVINIMLGK